MQAIRAACEKLNTGSVLSKYIKWNNEAKIHASYSPTRMMSPFGCNKNFVDSAVTENNGELDFRITINLFNNTAAEECQVGHYLYVY